MNIRLQHMLQVQRAALDYADAEALIDREVLGLIQAGIESGASLRDLARRVGKSPTYLCSIRQRLSKCSPATFVALCLAVAELEKDVADIAAAEGE